jgi:3-phenylpropionate/cinnamic acid dioxygenase small subunit
MSSDKENIIDLLNLYAVAIDTTRWDLFDAIFTFDVKVDFGPTMQWSGLETFKTAFAGFHDPFEATQHALTNHQVIVDGDEANSLCYGNWRLIRHVPGGGDLWEGTGWYDDVLVRTSKGWRIKDRLCRTIWWTGNPRVGEANPGDRFEHILIPIRGEAAAGRVRYMAAVDKKYK